MRGLAESISGAHRERNTRQCYRSWEGFHSLGILLVIKEGIYHNTVISTTLPNPFPTNDLHVSSSMTKPMSPIMCTPVSLLCHEIGGETMYWYAFYILRMSKVVTCSVLFGYLTWTNEEIRWNKHVNVGKSWKLQSSDVAVIAHAHQFWQQPIVSINQTRRPDLTWCWLHNTS